MRCRLAMILAGLAALSLLLVVSASAATGWVAFVDTCTRAVGAFYIDKTIIAVCTNGTSTFLLKFDREGRIMSALTIPFMLAKAATVVDTNLVVAGSVNGTAALVDVSNATLILIENVTSISAIDKTGKYLASDGGIILLDNGKILQLVGVEYIHAVASTGNILVVGGSYDEDAELVAINLSSARVLWSKRISTIFPDWVSAISIDDEAKIVYAAAVVGYPPDVLVAAFNLTNGEQLWVRVLDSGGSDIASGLELVGRHVIVVGYSSGLGHGYSILVIMLDKSGRVVRSLTLSGDGLSLSLPRHVDFSAPSTTSILVPGSFWSGGVERAFIAYTPTLPAWFKKRLRLEPAKLISSVSPLISDDSVEVVGESNTTTTTINIKILSHDVDVSVYPISSEPTTTTPSPSPLTTTTMVGLVVIPAILAAVLALRLVLRERRWHPRRHVFVRRKVRFLQQKEKVEIGQEELEEQH